MMIVPTKVGDVVKTEKGIGIVIGNPKGFTYIVQTRKGKFTMTGFNIGSVYNSCDLKEVIAEMIKEPN